jgi:hypothetical protein
LTSEDAPGTLNGCCIPACRLLPTFAKTKNNDEKRKAKIINPAGKIESLLGYTIIKVA